MINAIKLLWRVLWRLAFLTVFACVAWYFGVQWWTDGKMSDVADAPTNRVGLVFGARVYGNGRLSAMTADRVKTAVQLYDAGKLDTLIFSGDNRTDSYDEPGSMMAYAAQLGVPANAMQVDASGLRTYDTCYRAKHIFGVESATLITQEFHLPRAIATCEALGVNAVGVIADQRRYSNRSLEFSETREVPATLLAFFDVIRRQPATIMEGG